MTDGADAKFEALLEFLRRSRGFNFGGYKRASLMRRVGRRMQAVGIAEYEDYIDYLEVHSDEFAYLFDSILINVTDFFRDPLAWKALAEEAIPRIVAAKAPGEPIRCWSAGCANGAEPYTLAIVLAEALGLDEFRTRVKIYATDLDDGALQQARTAAYEPRQLEAVPPELVEKYFEPIGQRFLANKDLRRAVIFGRHDLMQDAPISKVDLLVCRNTLMYFNGEAQQRVLDRFHFGLNDTGFLFLGKAETLLSYQHMFAGVDVKRRLFAKVSRGGRRYRGGLQPLGPAGTPAGALIVKGNLLNSAFDQSPLAQLVFDASGRLVLVNEPARRSLGLGRADLGRPLQDLTISYRPADLRSCVDRAVADRRPVTLLGVEWDDGPSTTSAAYNIHVVPLEPEGGTLLGVTIAFADVTETIHAKDLLESSTRELETAQEELQSANEELETTNEELQSANEELETTNEELQSANEELETTNEELQSANEELEAVNEELRLRGDELYEANFFLESVLSSLNAGLAVIGPGLVVRAWNPRAEDLWGLRSDEVRGQVLTGLDIGLPVQQLRQPVQACLDGVAPSERLVLEATNRRGRPILCQVTCTPMRDAVGIRGAVLVMEDLDGTPAGPPGPVAEPETPNGTA